MGAGTVHGTLAGSWELIMLDSLVQPEYKRRCLVLIKFDTPALLMSMGCLPLSEQIWRRTGLRRE